VQVKLMVILGVYGENDLPHGEGSFVVPVVAVL
jgi:hypothetical protein